MPWNIIFWMNCEIKMPQNFLALKYISFYFVTLQYKTMSDKNDKNFIWWKFCFSVMHPEIFWVYCFLVQWHPMPLSPTVARELFFSKQSKSMENKCSRCNIRLDIDRTQNSACLRNLHQMIASRVVALETFPYLSIHR